MNFSEADSLLNIYQNFFSLVNSDLVVGGTGLMKCGRFPSQTSEMRDTEMEAVYTH